MLKLALLRLINKLISCDAASLSACLFVFLVVADVVASSYTIYGGFHAERDPILATNCVAGFQELIRTILCEPEAQQQLLCFALLFFILTTLNCFFTLSYLGLYGVFVVQLLTLTFFWLSLLVNFNTFIIIGGTTHLVLFKWFTIASSLVINFEFYLDIISFSFALLTTSIAIFVNIYAFSYFRYEPNVDRLILFINSFVISMVLLVFAGNLVMLFMG